jgi:L-fuconolactonase
MFGSDWPVCTLRSTYAEWWGWAQGLTDSLSAHEKDALFGTTAQRFYGLT